jgi:GAF domain-containing protein
LLAPLVARDNVLGFAALEALGPRRRPAKSELDLCTTVAAQVAIAVLNAGLFDQNSRQARRERLINQITDRIRRAVDVSGVLATTATELGETLGAGRARVEINLQAPAALAGARGNGNGAGLGAGNGQEASE